MIRSGKVSATRRKFSDNPFLRTQADNPIFRSELDTREDRVSDWRQFQKPNKKKKKSNVLG